MYISYIVLCDIYIMKLMYVYVQTLIMLLRLGMHTKYINKNKTAVEENVRHCLVYLPDKWPCRVNIPDRG